MYLSELKDCPYKQTSIGYSKNSLISDFLNICYVGKLAVRISTDSMNKSNEMLIT